MPQSAHCSRSADQLATEVCLDCAAVVHTYWVSQVDREKIGKFCWRACLAAVLWQAVPPVCVNKSNRLKGLFCAGSRKSKHAKRLAMHACKHESEQRIFVETTSLQQRESKII